MFAKIIANAYTSPAKDHFIPKESIVFIVDIWDVIAVVQFKGYNYVIDKNTISTELDDEPLYNKK